MKPLMVLALAVVLCGCQSVVKYAPPNQWSADVRTLGPVMADSGRWPLALNVPPPEYTYAAALRVKAAIEYKVSESEVVLGEITVKYWAEMVGTIRSWEATAIAGQKPSPTAQAK